MMKKMVLRLISHILLILSITAFAYVLIFAYLNSDFSDAYSDRLVFWFVYSTDPPNTLNKLFELLIIVPLIAVVVSPIAWILVRLLSKPQKIPEIIFAPFSIVLLLIIFCFNQTTHFMQVNDYIDERFVIADTLTTDSHVYHLVYRVGVYYGSSDGVPSSYLLYQCDSLDLVCNLHQSHSQNQYEAEFPTDLGGTRIIVAEDNQVYIQIDGDNIYGDPP